MPQLGTTSRSAIDVYVDELSGAMRGPRAVKADLLAEARDSLVDAADAFEADGMRRDAAECAAVAGFGPSGEIAEAYRAELGHAQGRRTAVLLSAVVLVQPLVWAEGVWPWGTGDPRPDPGPVYAVLDRGIEVVGGLVIVGAVLAVLACGIGVRFDAVRRRAARVTAIFTLATCVTMPSMAAGLVITGRISVGAAVVNLLWMALLLIAPLSVAGLSARRCLAIT